jgi:hypothetical protein
MTYPAEKDLDSRFRPDWPNADQSDRYLELRVATRLLVEKIAAHCPISRERSLAVTAAEEAVMWACRAILIGRGRGLSIQHPQKVRKD